MEYTVVPSNYASISEPIIFEFCADQSGVYDLVVEDAESGSVIAVKRFVDVLTGRVDIAPYLRDRVVFEPLAEPMGFCGVEERFLSVVVAVGGVRSDRYVFVPYGRSGRVDEVVISDFGRQRVVFKDGIEELLFDTLKSIDLVVKYSLSSGDQMQQQFEKPEGVISAFRFSPKELSPEVVSVELSFVIDGAEESVVNYRVVDALPGAVQMAWRSANGAFEHYMFPLCREVKVDVTREKCYGRDGYVDLSVDSSQVLTLASAYEPQARLRALASILSAEQVWLLSEGEYLLVDVLDSQSSIMKHGSLCCVEVQIRSKHKGVGVCI